MGGEPSGDFWDGFHAEEHEAGVQPPAVPDAPAMTDPSPAEIRLEASEDEEQPAKVGGWGSGLFTEEDDERSYPPAFGGSAESSEDRGWSYYDDEDESTQDRGWSYDDPVPGSKRDDDDDDEEPAFRSPAADREELVEKSSRLKDLTSWRPTMPSFDGGSSLGMRAREAIEVLDAILEENGTEDIPRPMLIGLLGLVGVLALIALIAFIF